MVVVVVVEMRYHPSNVARINDQFLILSRSCGQAKDFSFGLPFSLSLCPVQGLVE
jgi:hypothetical protein